LKDDEVGDWFDQKQRFRFAVVDLERSKDYPLNFVCILPMRLNAKGEKRTEFEKLFGEPPADLFIGRLRRKGGAFFTLLCSQAAEEFTDILHQKLRFLEGGEMAPDGMGDHC
jgi:hypothetical protein